VPNHSFGLALQVFNNNSKIIGKESPLVIFDSSAGGIDETDGGTESDKSTDFDIRE
jgi:hypothetical protein